MLHQNTANEKWNRMTLAEQLGNIGSEFGRLSFWLKKNAEKNAEASLDRILELLDLSIADSRWRPRQGELSRLREAICDFYNQSGFYGIKEGHLESYFLPFALLARS